MWGIDVDCHKAGTIEGARKAAEMLAYYLPGIYTEASTHGKGVHGYVVLDYQDHGPEDTLYIKETYSAFIKTLDRKAKQIGIDIELIEPKGLPVNVVRASNGSLTSRPASRAFLLKPREISKRRSRLAFIQSSNLRNSPPRSQPQYPKRIRRKGRTGQGKADSEATPCSARMNLTE